MKRRVIYPVLLLIAAVLVALNVYLWQLKTDKHEHLQGLDAQIGLHLQENQMLTDRNEGLRVEVETLRSPESYYSYEEKAREDYGMIAKNETYFVIADADIAHIDDVPGLAPTQAQQSASEASSLSSPLVLESTQTAPATIEPIAVSPIPLQLESLSGD